MAVAVGAGGAGGAVFQVMKLKATDEVEVSTKQGIANSACTIVFFRRKSWRFMVQSLVFP